MGWIMEWRTLSTRHSNHDAYSAGRRSASYSRNATSHGVLDATSFRDRCPQAGGLMAGGGAEGVGMSEDCLNLNIWKPKKSGTFPVMFWVHGGGYYTGAGNDPAYWGDRLAQAGDVIVVTINYRLSLLGFMTHPDLREEDPNSSTGGYGTMDQAAALKWVHDNIANFGGDPENITIKPRETRQVFMPCSAPKPTRPRPISSTYTNQRIALAVVNPLILHTFKPDLVLACTRRDGQYSSIAQTIGADIDGIAVG